MNLDTSVSEINGGLNACYTCTKNGDFLGNWEGFGGYWALGGNTENSGTDKAFSFGSGTLGVILVDPGAVFADVSEGDLSASHASFFSSLIETRTKEMGAAGCDDKAIEFLFGESMSQGLERFVLTPVASSFDVFDFGEGFGEVGEGFIVEGVADGVTAVTEKDANFHHVAPTLGEVG
jgi:hypothetical protein